MAYTKPRATCQDCGKPASPGATYCAQCSGRRKLGGVTPEQRSTHPLCGARKRDGTPCRLYAGQGTSHRGVGTCKLHGGNLPTHEAKALALMHQRDMVKFGQPIPHLKPSQALMGILRATAGHVSYLHTEIQALDDMSSPEASVLLRLYASERDRLTNIAGTCLRAGLSRAQVEVRAAMVDEFVKMVRQACEAAGFDDEMKHELGHHLTEATDSLMEQFPAAEVDEAPLWAAALDGDE
jgi:hypothetical protein